MRWPTGLNQPTNGVEPIVNDRKVAYFSMEIALRDSVPTYSGGLGALAGDTIRAAADLKIPMVAITLLQRKGYFFQVLDNQGRQTEEAVEWEPSEFLTELPERVSIELEGRPVQIRAWEYRVRGVDGFVVPVLLLDTCLGENDEWQRGLTDYLYGGDGRYRLSQEAVLGVGGVRMLRALGCTGLERFHLNEGHASLLTLELLREQAAAAGRKGISRDDVASVKEQCVFTTHTPVESGHDKFELDWASRVLGLREDELNLRDLFCHDGLLNLTYLGLSLSRYVNGVAMRHGEVSRRMFSGFRIDSITNGVHAAEWVSPAFADLFDKYVGPWRRDNFSLRAALAVPEAEIRRAHMTAKGTLIGHVNAVVNTKMDVDYFTIGFARRAAPYKRAALLVSDPARLKRIVEKVGPIQIIYAGKAHPKDETGKQIIERIYRAAEELRDAVRVCYLANYDLYLARLLTAGSDLWVNTPQPPLEASGTSGMKAALNGVPSLSVLDGWWIEGHIEGVTGWAIGDLRHAGDGRDEWALHAESLYAKLESTIVPMYYSDREAYARVMRNAIAMNGSFFNAHRMVQQYVLKAYSV